VNEEPARLILFANGLCYIVIVIVAMIEKEGRNFLQSAKR